MYRLVIMALIVLLATPTFAQSACDYPHAAGSISDELYDSTFNIQPRLDTRRTASMIQGSSLVGGCGFGLVEEICSWRAGITPRRNPVSRTPVDQT